MPRRAFLFLPESNRHVTWSALVKPGIGLGVDALLVGALLVGGYIEQQMAPRVTDESVSFLAPLKQYSPPPTQERLDWIGLAGMHDAQPGVNEPPVHDGTRPVAVETAGGAESDAELPPAPEIISERAMSEIEVDSTAALDPSAEGPQYPEPLLKAGIEGVVYARFIVDSTGYADPATLRLIDTADSLFVKAVKEALPRMKYRPAVYSGRRVSQLVEQAFAFRIRPPTM